MGECVLVRRVNSGALQIPLNYLLVLFQHWALLCGFLLFFPPNREPVLRLGLGRTLYTCRQGLGRTLSNDRLLLAAAMPVYAPILQTVTAVNFAFFRALNPHVKMDNKRDFTKEAKLLLNAILVITLISSNLS